MRNLGSNIGFGAIHSTNPNYALIPDYNTSPHRFFPTSPLHQHYPTQFQPPPINIIQRIFNNINNDTTLLRKIDCVLTKLLPLLHNLKPWDETLIGLKNYYDSIILYLTAYTNNIKPILINLQKVNLAIPCMNFLLLWKPTVYTLRLSRHIKLYPRTSPMPPLIPSSCLMQPLPKILSINLSLKITDGSWLRISYSAMPLILA